MLNIAPTFPSTCGLIRRARFVPIKEIPHDRHGHLNMDIWSFLVKRFVGLRVLYIYSFAFDLVELGECTRIRGSARRWVLRMARGPVGTFTALDTPGFEDLVFRSSNSERRRTLLPNLDDSAGLCDGRSISQRTRVAANTLRPLLSQPLPHLQNSAMQSLKSQRPCGRSEPVHRNVFGVCNHLDPMGRGSKWSLPDDDQQKLWRANYAILKGGSPREGSGVYDGTGLPPRMPEWLPSATNLARTSPRPHHRVPPKTPRDGSVTLEVLPGAPGLRHVVRLLARVLCPMAFSQTSARRPVHGKDKRFWSRHLKRWRTARKPCVNSLLPTTTRGGCSSVSRTKPVVSVWPSARATRLAAHKASRGAAHTFDASWSEEFNTVAGDDKF